VIRLACGFARVANASSFFSHSAVKKVVKNSPFFLVRA